MARFNPVYTIAYWLMQPAFRTYFRRREVVGYDPTYKNTPVIYAANHTNAFLDPIVIALTIQEQTSFLTRSDVFLTKLSDIICRSLGMLPIYRQIDGAGAVQNNQRTFDQCQELLADNGSCIIFIEGSQMPKLKLRPAKKGAARIIFGAEEAHNFNLHSKIVPVGINYDSFHNSGYNLLLEYGKPVEISEYYDVYKTNPKKALRLATQVAHQNLKKTMYHIENDFFYITTDALRRILNPEIHQITNTPIDSLLNQRKAHQKFINAFENWIKKNPVQAEEIKVKVSEFEKLLQSEKLSRWMFEKPNYKLSEILSDLVILLISSPLTTYGAFFNLVAYTVPQKRFHKKLIGTQFTGSVKMAAGMMIMYVYWIILTLFSTIWLDGIWIWAFFLSLPFTGWAALKMRYRYHKLVGKIKYNKRTKSGKRAVKQIAELRAEFVKLLSTVMLPTKEQVLD